MRSKGLRRSCQLRVLSLCLCTLVIPLLPTATLASPSVSRPPAGRLLGLSAFGFPPSAFWPLPQAATERRAAEQECGDAAAEVIDINRATAEDFTRLPGIGPELARRIVAFREKHGPFRRVEDLLAIRGIGHKKWKAIRPYLRVGDASEQKK